MDSGGVNRMSEIKDMPFAGVHCFKETNLCTAWWVQTIEDKTITVEVKN